MSTGVLERTTVINFPVYMHKVHLVITNDIVKSRYRRNDTLKSMYGTDEQPGGLFCTKEGDHYNSYIFLNHTADIDVIAHEAFHAVCNIMTTIGTTLNDGSEECYAYTLGYLSGQIEKFILSVYDDFKKKKKKKDVKTKSK